MAKLYLKALAITFLLPALCEGASCVNGQLDQTQIDDFVLNPINSRREKLVAGTQKNGNSGQNLPPAKGMPAMVSYCLFNLLVVVFSRPGGRKEAQAEQARCTSLIHLTPVLKIKK
ncbi:hypothetical protein ANCCAN_10998 [Ancylostoma caninum]|uniref:Uncharacterized protein n=1 Tax=Ancylostoma caninum TaxID=29170 RepID=A0A368GH85_ANCCA|nr:hypothetical protein ANCCAN_10998 [Ancylostoma caninum]